MLTREMNDLRNSFISKTIGASGDGEIEFSSFEDLWLAGARVGLSGHIKGETIDFQIWHPLLGHLEEFDFGKSVNVNPESWVQMDKIERYWAFIQTGVIVKIIHNKSELNPNEVKIYADFYMHKEK